MQNLLHSINKMKKPSLFKCSFLNKMHPLCLSCFITTTSASKKPTENTLENYASNIHVDNSTFTFCKTWMRRMSKFWEPICGLHFAPKFVAYVTLPKPQIVSQFIKLCHCMQPDFGINWEQIFFTNFGKSCKLVYHGCELNTFQ